MKSPRSNKHETRYVVSVLFPDGSIKYLAGHVNFFGPEVCAFTTDPEQAVYSHIRDSLRVGWPYLLQLHAQGMALKLRAIVHKISETPKF